MAAKTRKLAGRTTRIEISPRDREFSLSIGRVTFSLHHEEAEDLLEQLGYALLVEASGGDGCDDRLDDGTAVPVGARDPQRH
ncbi:MAG TPA: hypothetical protein VHG72_11430 [Polyangia bacterium]|nr:hypothetical protein [Polyangia bacterium]